jgi:DNA repair exonuclease SbcCD ATPase subunit
MLSLFCLLFLVGIGCSQDEIKNQPVMDSFYQRWIDKSIVSSFLAAYTTLNKNIIEKVISVNPDSNAKAIKSLINYLQCQFETIPKQLRRASDASKRIRDLFEREEKTLLQKIGSQEKRVQSKEKDVNDTKTKLEHSKKQVKDNEKAEEDYQKSVDAAQREVDAAQEAVNEYNKCRRRRRKKRFLFSICGSFGEKGWKNAQDRMSLAVHGRHKVQHRLQFQKQIFKNYQFRHQTAVSQLDATVTQLNTLQSKLNQTRTAFKRITMLTKGFKEVEVYLKEILGSSTVFKDQLMDLMDFQNVIEPLNDIYQQMIDNKLIKLNNNKNSSEIIQPTSERLERVKEIVKDWDVIMIDDNKKMTVGCLSFDDD